MGCFSSQFFRSRIRRLVSLLVELHIHVEFVHIHDGLVHDGLVHGLEHDELAHGGLLARGGLADELVRGHVHSHVVECDGLFRGDLLDKQLNRVQLCK